MRKIKNIETLGTWKPSDIAFIKKIEWSNNNLVMTTYCQAKENEIVWPNTKADFSEVSINFENVFNLKLEFANSNLQQIMGFDIRDVSTNGLENINFQIEDYENGIISFSCEEIGIIEAKPPLKLTL